MNNKSKPKPWSAEDVAVFARTVASGLWLIAAGLCAWHVISVAFELTNATSLNPQERRFFLLIAVYQAIAVLTLTTLALGVGYLAAIRPFYYRKSTKEEVSPPAVFTDVDELPASSLSEDDVAWIGRRVGR